MSCGILFCYFLVDMFLGFFGWWVFVEFSFVIFGGYVLRIFWLVDVLWNFRLIFLVDIFLGYFGWWMFCGVFFSYFWWICS